jgi:hypothetical protein
MEKYGFVYIWRDKKHNRYYIGCHWGTEDDNYVCSSRWMRKSYKRRPLDFKRKILCRINTSRQDLLIEENYWLSMITDELLGKKYYNLTKHMNGHWAANPDKVKIIGKKISEANIGKSKNKGRIVPSETRQKISKTCSLSMKTYYQEHPRNDSTCKKISENTKRLQIEGKIGMRGKTHSAETKHKMSMNNAMNNEELRKKIGDSNRGSRALILNGIKKMAKPNTEKWNQLLTEGYIPIEKGFN